MRSRSPSYPGIDLATALDRARTVYEREGRQPAAVDTLYDDWGLKPRSGAGGVVLAALKKFGLLADEGAGASRHGRLTDLALTILLEETGSAVRDAAIQQAALLPGVHQEVWERYDGGLPSDASLRLWLIRDRGFTPNGSDEFIAQMKRTFAFAGMTSSDRVGGGGSGPATEESRGMPAPNTRKLPSGGRSVEPIFRPVDRPPATRSILLPLGVGWATLEAPFPLSEEAWSLMISELTAMKPGLVAGSPQEGGPDEGGGVPRWQGVTGA
jgi:hypothetical protein